MINNEGALQVVEKMLVERKREAKDFEERGLPVPPYITRKIENLKGAAVELRKKSGRSDP
jgi:hypothetical protein